MKFGLILLLGSLAFTGCKSEPTLAKRSANLVLFDPQNRMVNPFQSMHAKGFVFFFVRTDCPISNRYAPEMERFASSYAKEGIIFWLIYPESATSPQEIERHRKDYHLSLQALRDPRHELVKMANVLVTPEAAIFLPDGREVYRGRIDDRYVDFGKERPAPTTHDLDEALGALVEGKPITSSVTRAIGCYIE